MQDMLLTEMGVIGCLMMEPQTLETALKLLSPKMFASEPLARVYGCMLKLRKAGLPADAVTVVGKLGAEYQKLVVQCAEVTPSLSSFGAYATAVLDAWRVRTLQQTAMQLAAGDGTADEMLAVMADEVKHQYEILRAVRESTEKDFSEALFATYQQIMQKDTSLKTGWKSFDAVVGGLQRGCLYIIAARPGKGKTDFALQLAVTLSKQHSVTYHSMEMTTEQLMHRVLSRALKINSVRIRDRELTEKDFAKIDLVHRHMSNLHLVLDDAPALCMEEVQEKTQRRKPDAIFLDYLGLMRGNDKKAQWEQTQEITHALKALAKHENMAVVALVQLNREVDKRTGKPTLADLRGGGSVEADADGVFFMNPSPTKAMLSGGDGVECGVMVEKNRYGGCGELPFFWQPQYHTYTPMEVERNP